jgi:hypothetical protein
MVYVDAGTVHAIGPGVTVLETQEYSDITYRLYDYGRPRELHVEQGLAVVRNSSEAGLVAPVAMQGFVRLVASPYFVVDRFSVDGEAELGAWGRCRYWWRWVRAVRLGRRRCLRGGRWWFRRRRRDIGCGGWGMW